MSFVSPELGAYAKQWSWLIHRHINFPHYPCLHSFSFQPIYSSYVLATVLIACYLLKHLSVAELS